MREIVRRQHLADGEPAEEETNQRRGVVTFDYQESSWTRRRLRSIVAEELPDELALRLSQAAAQQAADRKSEAERNEVELMSSATKRRVPRVSYKAQTCRPRSLHGCSCLNSCVTRSALPQLLSTSSASSGYRVVRIGWMVCYQCLSVFLRACLQVRFSNVTTRMNAILLYT